MTKSVKMKKDRNRAGLYLIGFGGLMLVMVIIMIIPTVVEFWQKPLGPGLGFEETPTVLAEAVKPTTEAPPPAETIPPDEITAPLDTPTPIAMPTFTEHPYCGDDASMLVLAIGIDYRKGTYTYGLADVIRLVNIDFETKPCKPPFIRQNRYLSAMKKSFLQFVIGTLFNSLLNQYVFFN